TAERRFHRFRNAVELTVKNRQIEIHRRLMLEAQYAREAREAETKKDAEAKKAKAKSADAAETKESPFDRYPKCTVLPIPQLHQFISVSVQDGQTHTKFHPSNEELLKREPIQTPPPIQVTRRIACLGKFWPPEYLWVRREMPWPQVTDQVLTMEEWHAALEREKNSPHIGPKSPQPLEDEPNEPEPGDQDEKNGFS
ncbi:MAG: hypothetical protein JO211_16640, partial [Acidobacteriaceae bacterium]|nr:hypothetical protein [Acidobacteriaceae bacterium]